MNFSANMSIYSSLGDPPGSQDRLSGDHFLAKMLPKRPTPNDPKRPGSGQKSVLFIFTDFRDILFLKCRFPPIKDGFFMILDDFLHDLLNVSIQI